MNFNFLKDEQVQIPFGRFFDRCSSAVRWTVILLAAIVCGAQALVQPPAAITADLDTQDAEALEYKVKAAFIYNFTKFTVWPPEKHQAPESQNGQAAPAPKPLVIGILGKNPFKDAFVPILSKDAGKPIELIEIGSFAEFQHSYSRRSDALDAYRKAHEQTLGKCDVLFVCDSEKSYAEELIALTAGRSILTVSDMANFIGSGGMIGFVKDNNKIRFEVNLKAAQKENLKIGSQLLGLARKVYK